MCKGGKEFENFFFLPKKILSYFYFLWQMESKEILSKLSYQSNTYQFGQIYLKLDVTKCGPESNTIESCKGNNIFFGLGFRPRLLFSYEFLHWAAKPKPAHLSCNCSIRMRRRSFSSPHLSQSVLVESAALPLQNPSPSYSLEPPSRPPSDPGAIAPGTSK